LKENEQRDRLRAQSPLVYPLASATTHTAIFGTTGGGKSITTKRLIREFVTRGVNVLILDWHDEYAELIRELGGKIVVPPTAITKPGSDEEPFTWNLLDPHFYNPDITPDVIEDYIRIIVDLLSHKDLMDLSEPMKGGLSDTLRIAYGKVAIPTFDELVSLVDNVRIPASTKDALRRRIRAFSSGSLGAIFCHLTSFEPSSIFERPVCLKVKCRGSHSLATSDQATVSSFAA
jgi:DNA helicase HerA-like ATPase